MVDDNSEAFPGVLVNDREHPKRFAVNGSVSHEVVRPDVIRTFGTEPDARTVTQPQPLPFRLLGRHFESFLSPDAFDSLAIDMPTCLPEQGGDPTVAIAAILGGQFGDSYRQGRFIRAHLRQPALDRPMLLERLARPSL